MIKAEMLRLPRRASDRISSTEGAQIGSSGVWLCWIVFDLSQSQGLELGDEFA